MNKLSWIFAHFFDNSSAFNGPYTFGVSHIVFIVISLITIPLLCILLRKVSHEKIKKYLIIYWAVSTSLEVFKIILESISIGHMNWSGLLPLYLCSIPMYIMPFAIWGKGKTKQSCLGFMCTFAILGGIANIIYPGILNGYPVFTSFAGLHSMLYHYAMVFTGFWLWTSKYYTPQKYDFIFSFLPLAIFSIPVIVLDKIFGWDYMFYNGGYFPFSLIASKMPQWLWTIVMFILYFAVISLFVYLPIFIVRKIKTKNGLKLAKQVNGEKETIPNDSADEENANQNS